MKHLLPIVLFLALVFPSRVPAQEASGEAPQAEGDGALDDAAVDRGAMDEEAIHDALRSLRDRAIDAINRSDVDELLETLDDDVVFTAMNAEVARGKDEVRAYFEKMMIGPDRIVAAIKTELQVDTLTILHGDDTGIAYGSSHDSYRLTSGLELEVDTRWSSTVVREGDRWLIASFHSSVNLFDNPLLAKSRGRLYWTGGLGLVLGLVIGLVLGRRRSAADA